MGWFDNMGGYLRSLKVHLFGKGIMTLAVLAASMLTPVIGSWVLPVVAIGGVILTTVSSFLRESRYKDAMVDLYRDDIAGSLGIDPREVTRAHLVEAAKSNDVIDQALTRQRRKTWIAIGTAVLSSAATYLLVGAFGLNTTLHNAALDFFGGSKIGTAIAGFVGIGTVASISSLIFQDGLQLLIGYKTGTREAAAHDQIVHMQQDLSRGRTVTKEQVYAVMADANPALRATITRQFRESYDHMSAGERAAVLETIGIAPEMQALADDINQRTIRPGNLAYLLQDATQLARDPVPAPEADAVATARSNFTDRLNLAPRAQQSYRAQVDAERAALVANRSMA